MTIVFCAINDKSYTIKTIRGGLRDSIVDVSAVAVVKALVQANSDVIAPYRIRASHVEDNGFTLTLLLGSGQ